VFVADANSTDDTVALAKSFPGLNVEVIPGGLPAVGRNAGAARANSRFLLFIDADIELKSPSLLRRALETMKRRDLQCVTTNILCAGGSLLDRVIYTGNNVVQYFSSWTKPFATGMFMMFSREKFLELGGFNEKALYAEDYLLSKQISPLRFGIVTGGVLTSNRRFKKMGHSKIIRMFFKTALNSWNESYFLKDHSYWDENEEAQHPAH
jgi:glycosyltransferase involved in cell wall biosynthesis